MTEEKKPEPLTQAGIDNLVSMCEAAEIIAQKMDLSVSRAMRFMLESTMIYQQRVASPSFQFPPITSKKVQ